jgi:hypothetical protein
MARPTTHGDWFGKVVAALVFVTGIAALIVVFVYAKGLFNSPVAGLGLPITKGQTPPSGLNIGVALIQLLRELVLLALMTLAGSLIASRGLHLYQVASASHQQNADPSAKSESTDATSSAPPAA